MDPNGYSHRSIADKPVSFFENAIFWEKKHMIHHQRELFLTGTCDSSQWYAWMGWTAIYQKQRYFISIHPSNTATFRNTLDLNIWHCFHSPTGIQKYWVLVLDLFMLGSSISSIWWTGSCNYDSVQPSWSSFLDAYVKKQHAVKW